MFITQSWSDNREDGGCRAPLDHEGVRQGLVSFFAACILFTVVDYGRAQQFPAGTLRTDHVR